MAMGRDVMHGEDEWQRSPSRPLQEKKNTIISFLPGWQLAAPSHLLWEVARTMDRGQTACFKRQEQRQMQQLTGKNFRNRFTRSSNQE